jgi:methionyl aminopeptidase
MPIIINNQEDIKKMRVAGKLASEVLDFITPLIEPNITTDKIDTLCHEFMTKEQGTIPAPLNYAPPGHSPFPKSICTSVNNQICHGIPGAKILKKGDIVNIDITVIKDGYHGDTSRMFFVGEPSIQAKRLCEITYQSMWLGIRQVKAGAHLGDIEPMINAGKKDIKVLPDKWTVVTKDRSLSAQWEHTILVTNSGYEVLTVSDKTPKPFLD